VHIHIDNADPQKAQLYANAIARAYVSQNLSAMHKDTLTAVDWLSARLDSANKELKKSEEALSEYKRENDILSISLEDRQNLITTQMTAVAEKLTEAKAKRIEIQSRKKAIAEVANIEDPMSIPVDALNTSSLIQQLKQDYASLSQEYGELFARYGKKHPKMVEIQAKMERIRTDIKREVNNIIMAVNAKLQAAKSTEEGLKRLLNKLKGDAQKLADKEGDYKDLARQVTNSENIYNLLKGRSEEARLTKYLKVNNVEILDPALLPQKPVKPRVFLNIALSAVIGLILGVALAIFIEFADRTIKTQEDIEALGLSFLGIVPAIDSAKKGGSYGRHKGDLEKESAVVATDGKINYDTFVHAHPKSQVAESLRSIRTNLLFMTADLPIKRLLVTSPSPQEGKTTVASNMAIVMAQSGSRVLLVDTDMRRPRVHKAFNLQRPMVGLSTMILGQTTAEQSIVKTPVPGLDILPCGPTPPNPSELLHTESFLTVIKELSTMYDRLIFDSPPVGAVTDAAILSKMVDGTVLIVKSLKTTRDAAKYATSVLRDINAEILGVVINGLDLANRKYGQYYHYYYRKYGYYYGDSSDQKTKKSRTRSDKHAV
jgi:capsular exopolysaccharide synthesis family protein